MRVTKMRDDDVVAREKHPSELHDSRRRTQAAWLVTALLLTAISPNAVSVREEYRALFCTPQEVIGLDFDI